MHLYGKQILLFIALMNATAATCPSLVVPSPTVACDYSNEVEYQFINEGKKTNVLFLHGLALKFDTLSHIYNHYVLQQQANVWSLSLQDHGNSFYDPAPSVESFAQTVLCFIKKNKIGNVYLVGYSLGGRVAMHIAANYPDYIEGMAIIDMVPFAFTSAQLTPFVQLLQSTLVLDISGKTLDQIKAYLNAAVGSTVAGILLLSIEGFDSQYRWAFQALPLIATVQNSIGIKIEGAQFCKPVRFIFARQSGFYPLGRIADLKLFYPNLDTSEHVAVVETDHYGLILSYRDDILRTIDSLLNN